MTVTSFRPSVRGALAAVAIAILLGCDGPEEPTAVSRTPAPATAVDLSPFLVSRFFELFDLGDDPKRLVDELDKLPNELAGTGGAAPGGPRTRRPSSPRAVRPPHALGARVGRWLLAAGAKPEIYAAMILTMDDGPFAGLPPGDGDLPPAS